MSTTYADVRGRAAEPERRTRLGVVIGALMLALLLAALDSTIVATALPTIVGELGGLDQYSWVVTAYLLTLTISTPLYGKLGDLYGRKRLFQGAIAIFLVGSALSGLSQTMTQLVAFRAFQGLGGGGLMVGAQAIVGDVVAPRERGRYQGWFGAVFGFASVAGPLVGGFLTDNVDWRWVFYVNLPVGLVALVATGIALDGAAERVHHAVDVVGTALLAAAVVCLILVTTWGGEEYAWGSAVIIGLAMAGLVLLALFVVAEEHAVEPLIPLGLFRSSIFSVCCAVSVVVGAALFGATTYLPQYQQVVRGLSATASGLQLVPLMAGVVVASLGSGQLISRSGRYRVYPLAGTLLMAIGLLLLSGIGVDTNAFVLGGYMVVLGLGIGSVMQVLVLVAQNAVDPKDLGTATSTATFFRTIGGTFGVALFGAVFNASLAEHPTPADVGAYADALGAVFLAGVPLALVAFVIALLLPEAPLRSSADAAGNLAGAGASFGLSPLATAGVIEEVTVRVRAARAALARLDQLSTTRELPPDQLRGLRRLFEHRIEYLTEAMRRVQSSEAAEVPTERWRVLVELLEVERTTTAGTDGSGDGGMHGAAAARWEADVRIAGAQAALDRLDQLEGMAQIRADNALFLRELFEHRIVRIEERAERGLAAAADLPPAGWDVVLEVLATERRELAAYREVDAVTEATARRAGRQLDAELALVGP